MNPKRSLLFAALTLALAVQTSHASYNQPGQGLQTVLSGTVSDGALYFGSQATWLNTANPAVGQPYNVNTSFTMPSADSIVNGRLILTLWGGTANYTANLAISINGNSLVTGGLNFGSTSDANVSFSATQPSVYGSGSGVWLVGLPVNADYLHTDGTANFIAITVTDTGTGTFDGRLQQVSVLSVYQNAVLNNQFQYAIAEGSGDIYKTPGTGQTDNRTISFGGLTLANPTAATLAALYTYGDAGQNDRLYFNGTQLGGNDIATWAPSGTGLSYGPDYVTNNVLSLLQANNSANFSVGADVPGTRETSLRPEIAALEITQAIPEPSTIGLVALGLGALAFKRRCRQP